MKPSKIEGPLAAFQSTSAYDAKDTRRLINDLTLLLPDRRENQWDDALNQGWPNKWENSVTDSMGSRCPR